MASLLSGRRRSLLDQPIGIDAQRKRDMEDRRIRREVQQTNKIARAGKAAYRMSMRQNNPAMALQAISWMKENGVISNFSSMGPGDAAMKEAYQTSMDQQKAGEPVQQGQAKTLEARNQPYVPSFAGSDLFDRRKGLFDDIKNELNWGNDPQSNAYLKERAKELGVNESAFGRGMERAKSSLGFFK